MSALSLLKKIQKLQATNLTQKTTTVAKPSAASSDFDNILKAILPQNSGDSVSEEELFAGLAGERVSATKGADALEKFNTAFAQNKAKFTRPDGFVGYEAATLDTLKQLTASNVLTADEGNSIYSQAFAGAQLDSNTSVLWDSRKGANDNSVAVEKLATALTSAKKNIDDFAANTTAVTELDLATAGDGVGTASVQLSTSTGTAPTGTITAKGAYIDGANGFLFKPVSSNEGRLAVLLPESMAHLVSQVVLKDKDGMPIEEGRSVSFGDTGTREKFSFTKAGGSYPKNLTVEVTMSSGSVTSYKIPDPSQRYD